MGSANESSVQMHRIIFFNDFLDDPTVRMLTGPLSSVGKKYSKNNKSGLSYFLVGMFVTLRVRLTSRVSRCTE